MTTPDKISGVSVREVIRFGWSSWITESAWPGLDGRFATWRFTSKADAVAMADVVRCYLASGRCEHPYSVFPHGAGKLTLKLAQEVVQGLA